MKRRQSLVVISVTSLLFISLFFYWRGWDEGEVSAISGDENSEMAEIPAGSFIMGSEDGEFDEKPLHKVELDGFYMDRYEVTNLQYRRFILANPHWQKGNPKFEEADYNYLSDWNGTEFPKGKEEHPVVYISWYAANAYAQWAGKSLPAEAQWEYAARGGYEGMRYVWGDSWEAHLSNWGNFNNPRLYSLQPVSAGIQRKGALPVGSFSMNGFGINDMAGNVWEWTADGYEIYMDWEVKNPSPRLNNHLKVIRGGSWKSNMNEIRLSIRRAERPNVCREDIGFRTLSSMQ